MVLRHEKAPSCPAVVGIEVESLSSGAVLLCVALRGS